MVKGLLEQGANPNISEDGETPLHVAALNGFSEIIKELVEHGAHVDAENEGENGEKRGGRKREKI